MKSYILLLPLLFFTFIHLSSFGSDHQQGQMIVLLHTGKDVNVLVRKHSDTGHPPAQLHIAQQLSGAMNIWLLSYDPATNENELLNLLRADDDVAAAQFNYFIDERNIPNDSLFDKQWNLYNTGQSGGIPGADIHATDAWDITTGGITAQGDTIVIAIIDCGFDLSHADLNFWKNYKEIPGNKIDDDSNGYTDDFNGWSAAGNDTIPVCFHGTHVAGIAGARGNNTIGITGVNRTVKVMPLSYYDGNDASVIACYGYAFHMRKLYNTTYGAKGAFVVATNTSFGKNFGKPVDHPVWCAMFDSLGSVGILSAGAGPDIAINVDISGDIPTTCSSNWLVSVTNTTKEDKLHNKAGWGPINMDLGAPGDSIWSTIPNNLYGQLTGTSMSAPHIAGAVAMMWAAACDEMITDYKRNPATLASVMKTIMMDNIDTIPALQNITVSNGRLNLYTSLLGVQNYCKRYSPEKPFSIFIYPNPAGNTAYLDFFSYQKPATLQVNDMLGRNIFIHSTEKVTGQGMETLQLDLTGLNAGMYFVRLLTNDNSYSSTHKLIIQ